LEGDERRRLIPRLAVSALSVAIVAVGIVAAGLPARGTSVAGGDALLNDIPTNVDPSTLPAVTVDTEVRDYDHELADDEMTEVVVTLARNLEVENQALLRRDDALLTAVDHGDRLAEMRARLEDADASGTTTLTHYAFDAIDVSLLVPFGVQTGMSLGLTGRGTMTVETTRADGVVDRESSPFELTFALRRATGDRWMNVAVLPPDG
jgi:hypothetical protein